MKLSALDLVIEARLNNLLTVPLRVAVASAPLDQSALTSAEQVKFAEVASTSRASSWLMGRGALKTLLGKIDRSLDTSQISFPNREFSLSHSGDFAIAIFADSSDVSGVGVDVELMRVVKPGAARFFLVDKEQEYICTLADCERSSEMLRLWTIKESLFKSDLHNFGKGLKHYVAHDPKAAVGEALCAGQSKFVYASFELDSLMMISGALKLVN